MDLADYGMIGIVVIVFALIFVEIFLVWLVASFLASFLGVTGIYWWAFAIVIFLLINAILGFLSSNG